MKRLNEKEILEELPNLDIAPLKITVQNTELYTRIPGTGVGKSYRPDSVVDLAWNNSIFRFLAEIKSVATPKILSSAVAELRQYTEFVNSNSSEKYYPLIVTAYLNEKQLESLISQNISGIDLSGNMALVVPEGLYVLKTGKQNRFPTVSSIKNVYRGNSSLVARTMLTGSPFPTVNDIWKEVRNRGGDITLGTVSKVLTALEEDFIVMRGFGISVADPNTLLANLRKNYVEPKAAKRMIGKVASVPDAMQAIALNCVKADYLYAIDEPQKYVVFPTVGIPLKIYVENIENALNGVRFEETTRFADIELIETAENTVYFDRNRDGEFFYTSPLQVYLSLTRGDKREQDVAEQLVERIVSGGGR